MPSKAGLKSGVSKPLFLMIRFKFDRRLKLFNKNWWEPTKKEWVPKLMSDNRELWPLQVDYDGKPWKTLSPSYSRWKSRNYGSLPMLRLTGVMLDRASLSVRGNKFTVTTNDEGIYNQFGTDKMPARPWMGVPRKSMDTLSEISLNNLIR